MADTTSRTRHDWTGNLWTFGLVWGPPIVVIVVGLFLDAALRTGIWTIALGWMAAACLLNARRCGRTHCRYTGPFYLLMVLPVLAAGSGTVPIGPYGWFLLAAIIILFTKIIWWATERAWGKFS